MAGVVALGRFDALEADVGIELNAGFGLIPTHEHVELGEVGAIGLLHRRQRDGERRGLFGYGGRCCKQQERNERGELHGWSPSSPTIDSVPTHRLRQWHEEDNVVGLTIFSTICYSSGHLNTQEVKPSVRA